MYCLHPTKENPTSWRLEHKSLNVQEYFPFKRHGSKEAALLAVIQRDEELQPRLKAKELRKELGINQMFDESGNLKGISISKSEKRGILVKMQLTANGKQIGTDRRTKANDLIDIFNGLARWRMEKLGINSNLEIRRELQSSFRLFEMKYKYFLRKEKEANAHFEPSLHQYTA